MADRGFIIANAEIGGRPGQDVLVTNERIVAIGSRLRRDAPVFEAGGGALIRGLHDHHIHLLAAAAAMQSVKVDPVSTPGRAAFAKALRAAPGDWVRAIGYDECIAGPLDRNVLDGLAPDRPVRVQSRNGALWALNSRALNHILDGTECPDCVERDADGRPTGRIWRGDDWLRTRLPAAVPPLADLSHELARYGITAVTDTTATNGPNELKTFKRAAESGDILQRLAVMTGNPADIGPGHVKLGPVKITIDEADLPPLDGMVARIRAAHIAGRNAAVHCATATELALTLAAFEEAGPRPGDRLEHGSVIPGAAIPVIARLGLTVATQPALIAERGDRYLAEVPEYESEDLYRCASLRRAGIPVLGSSDAPYTAPDPWAAMRAAMTRETRNGKILGAGERVSPSEALALYSPAPVRVGDGADLCLLQLPLADAMREPDAGNVAATWIGGQLVSNTSEFAQFRAA